MIPSPYNKTLDKVKHDMAIIKLAQELVAVHERFIKKLEEYDLKKIGPKGDKPTKEELTEIILPLVSEIDGKTPTEEELLKIIRPLIPEIKNPTQEQLLDIIRPLIPSVEVPTKEDLVKEIMPLIPKEVDIENVARVAAAIVKTKLPKPQEIDIDELLKGKKIEVENINGLEELFKTLHKKHGNQRPYLHGGGVPSLSAGTNVTLVPKSDGGFTISVAGAGTWYEDEVPSGLKNGVNTTYTLAHIPTTVVFLFLNGQRLISGTDYTRAGATITMITAPLSIDTLTATYA